MLSRGNNAARCERAILDPDTVDLARARKPDVAVVQRREGIVEGTRRRAFYGPVLGLLLVLLPTMDTLADEADAPTVRTGELILESTTSELVEPATAARLEGVIPSDERLRWRTFVPANYDPSRPPGLLVYISPTRSGEVPRGWTEVLAQHNLIWLGADRSGNRELVMRRILLATLAVAVAKRRYTIDDERIYVTGLSGGGKTASMVATEYPQLFRGAIYNCGVEFWDVETPKEIDRIRRNRYVFVTGTHDQALEPTKRVHREYLDAGIENSKLMVIRNMTHRNPDSYDFAEAISYLDGGTGDDAPVDE